MTLGERLAQRFPFVLNRVNAEEIAAAALAHVHDVLTRIEWDHDGANGECAVVRFPVATGKAVIVCHSQRELCDAILQLLAAAGT